MRGILISAIIVVSCAICPSQFLFFAMYRSGQPQNPVSSTSTGGNHTVGVLFPAEFNRLITVVPCQFMAKLEHIGHFTHPCGGLTSCELSHAFVGQGLLHAEGN